MGAPVSGANIRGDTATEAPINVSELLTDPAGVPRARAMLQRAEWAARSFARYDKDSVDAVVRAAAAAGAAPAPPAPAGGGRESGGRGGEHNAIQDGPGSTGAAARAPGDDRVRPPPVPAAQCRTRPPPA